MTEEQSKPDLAGLIADIAREECRKLYEKVWQALRKNSLLSTGQLMNTISERKLYFSFFLAITTTVPMQPTNPMTASQGESKVKVFTGWTQPPTAAQQGPATSNGPETLSAESSTLTPESTGSVTVTV